MGIETTRVFLDRNGLLPEPADVSVTTAPNGACDRCGRVTDRSAVFTDDETIGEFCPVCAAPFVLGAGYGVGIAHTIDAVIDAAYAALRNAESSTTVTIEYRQARGL